MDYAEPITPGDTCRHMAERIAWLIEHHRFQAQEHLAVAKVLEEFHRDAEREARRFDDYQPSPKEPA